MRHVKRGVLFIFKMIVDDKKTQNKTDQNIIKNSQTVNITKQTRIK